MIFLNSADMETEAQRGKRTRLGLYDHGECLALSTCLMAPS